MKKFAQIQLFILLICLLLGTVSVQADAADVIFSISDEYCSDSGTIELEISVTSTAAHDSAVLYDLMFDKNAFAFTGFKDYSEIEKECQFPNGFDDG